MSKTILYYCICDKNEFDQTFQLWTQHGISKCLFPIEKWECSVPKSESTAIFFHYAYKLYTHDVVNCWVADNTHIPIINFQKKSRKASSVILGNQSLVSVKGVQAWEGQARGSKPWGLKPKVSILGYAS